MCGIVGYVGPKSVVSVIINGLRKLEYRGYDSAGVAVVNGTGKVGADHYGLPSSAGMTVGLPVMMPA